MVYQTDTFPNLFLPLFIKLQDTNRQASFCTFVCPADKSFEKETGIDPWVTDLGNCFDPDLGQDRTLHYWWMLCPHIVAVLWYLVQDTLVLRKGINSGQ